MSEARPPITEPVIFRRIFQGIYAVLLLGFFGTIAISATYGAFFAPMAPTETLPIGRADTRCEGRLTALFDTLETTAQALIPRTHESASEAEWKAFSERFRGRLQAIRSDCGLDDPKRADLAALTHHLERQRLGYETALRSLRQIAGPSRAQLVEVLQRDEEAIPSP